MTERRGEKYLADVVSAGANATSLQLYPAKVFEPIRPAIFPRTMSRFNAGGSTGSNTWTRESPSCST